MGVRASASAPAVSSSSSEPMPQRTPMARMWCSWAAAMSCLRSPTMTGRALGGSVCIACATVMALCSFSLSSSGPVTAAKNPRRGRGQAGARPTHAAWRWR